MVSLLGIGKEILHKKRNLHKNGKGRPNYAHFTEKTFPDYVSTRLGTTGMTDIKSETFGDPPNASNAIYICPDTYSRKTSCPRAPSTRAFAFFPIQPHQNSILLCHQFENSDHSHFIQITIIVNGYIYRIYSEPKYELISLVQLQRAKIKQKDKNKKDNQTWTYSVAK